MRISHAKEMLHALQGDGAFRPGSQVIWKPFQPSCKILLDLLYVAVADFVSLSVPRCCRGFGPNWVDILYHLCQDMYEACMCVEATDHIPRTGRLRQGPFGGDVRVVNLRGLQLIHIFDLYQLWEPQKGCSVCGSDQRNDE